MAIRNYGGNSLLGSGRVQPAWDTLDHMFSHINSRLITAHSGSQQVRRDHIGKPVKWASIAVLKAIIDGNFESIAKYYKLY
jgi:hypothetical protein